MGFECLFLEEGSVEKLRRQRTGSVLIAIECLEARGQCFASWLEQ